MNPCEWRIPAVLSAVWRGLERAGRPALMMPYRMEFNLGNLANGVLGAPQVLYIEGEGDFFWMGQSYAVEVDGSGDLKDLAVFPAGAMLVRLKIQGTDNYLGRHRSLTGDNSWLPLPGIAGSGTRPFFWSYPYRVPASGGIVAQALNQFTLALSVRVYLTLIGMQLRPLGRAA